MNSMNISEHFSVPDKLISKSGRVFLPGNKALIESLPADIVREIAKRQMEEIEVAGAGCFPELHKGEEAKQETVKEPALAMV
jgi:hypothetical protein